jgi:hypothetical protein
MLFKMRIQHNPAKDSDRLGNSGESLLRWLGRLTQACADTLAE